MTVSGWLLLVYRVPVAPARHRVMIRRALQRRGGLYLQQCVCLLPNDRSLELWLASWRHQIDQRGGSSILLDVPHVPKGASLFAGCRITQ